MKVIATHASSDFDAFSGMVAAKKIYPDARIILPTSLNKNVREFIILHSDLLPSFEDPSFLNNKKITELIMIDTRIYSRLGFSKDLSSQKDITLISYDHHKKSKHDERFDEEYLREVGSTTTILVDIIKKKSMPISKIEATLFALGIYEDTGSLTYSNATHKDAEIVSFLLKKGADLYTVGRFLSFSLTKEQHKLLEKLILSYRKIKIYDKVFILANTRTGEFIEGLSIVTKKISQIEDVDIAFCWVDMKGKTYLVGRSADKDIDVSRVIESLGGGGHPQAASAVVDKKDIPKIEETIIKNLKILIRKPMTAKDVMSYPVRTVDEDTSVSEVLEILKKYGHSGIPIVDKDNSLAGIITRKDIDKAIKHGLSHAPVKGFKSHGIITAKPDSTIYQVRKMMVENGIGRVPITKKKDIVGIVTRKDILRHIHGVDFFDTKISDSLKRRDLKEKIDGYFPAKYKKILKLSSSISRKLGFRAFLVGGIVRDMIIGVENLDIDIVIEGDGIEFAKKISKSLDAKVESHRKFNTAVIILPDGSHIDIATSRIEYYERPAALPSVETGSIRQDLARRDFTINAMALSLNKDDFGNLLDFFGGLKDIEEKKIRVLHKLSFIEDPTRVFRAVRFEQRYGFEMDRQTERLVNSYTVLETMEDIVGARLRDELIAIMSEESPWKPLERLGEIGALKRIGMETRFDRKFIKLCESSVEKYKVFSKKFRKETIPWRLLLILLFLQAKPAYTNKWMLKMKFKKKDISVVVTSIKKHDFIKKRLSENISKNSELYRLLSGLPMELLVIISTYSDSHERSIEDFMELSEKTRVSIDGNDLKEMGYKPSRKFKQALERLFMLKLDGKLKDRQQEIEEVKKIFR